VKPGGRWGPTGHFDVCTMRLPAPDPVAIDFMDLIEREPSSGSKDAKERTAWAARARDRPGRGCDGDAIDRPAPISGFGSRLTLPDGRYRARPPSLLRGASPRFQPTSTRQRRSERVHEVLRLRLAYASNRRPWLAVSNTTRRAPRTASVQLRCHLITLSRYHVVTLSPAPSPAPRSFAYRRQGRQRPPVLNIPPAFVSFASFVCILFIAESRMHRSRTDKPPTQRPVLPPDSETLHARPQTGTIRSLISDPHKHETLRLFGSRYQERGPDGTPSTEPVRSAPIVTLLLCHLVTHPVAGAAAAARSGRNAPRAP